MMGVAPQPPKVFAVLSGAMCQSAALLDIFVILVLRPQHPFVIAAFRETGTVERGHGIRTAVCPAPQQCYPGIPAHSYVWILQTLLIAG